MSEITLQKPSKKSKPKTLTQARLKEMIHYDPETGVFRWIQVNSRCIKIGDVAGCVTKSYGYRRIYIDNKSYLASRLAWLYVEGYFPENEVDHRNRIKNDDKFINLRHVTHKCNSKNINKRKNNRSGVTGVCWEKRRQKWISYIRYKDRNIYLGQSNELRKAVMARWEAEKKYNYPNCNATSTAYLYLKSRGLV